MNRPDYECEAYTRQQAALTLVRDLSGGTKRLRERGEAYLPREKGEKPEAYKLRLARAVLFNSFRKTFGGLVGMVLKDSPVFSVPSLINQHLEDIDLAGNHVDPFLKEFFLDVVSEGHAHILIDMEPMLATSITSAASTPDLGDELVANRRPFWVKYKKDQAINWTSARISGETVLTHITFRECSIEPAGKYGQKEVTRYRVFRLPKISDGGAGKPPQYGLCMWELWEKPEKGDELIPRGSDVTKLSRIPVVTVYSKQIGFMESEPPLLDLGYLNVSHYQQLSDHNNQLRWLLPALFRKQGVKVTPLIDDDGPTQQQTGAGKAEEVQFGYGAIIDGYGSDADLKYVSHSGENVRAASDALKETERRMSELGLANVTDKAEGQAPTATHEILSASERTSELQTWARALADGVDQALYFHGQYLNMNDGGSVEIGVSAVDSKTVASVPAKVPQQLPSQSSAMVQ